MSIHLTDESQRLMEQRLTRGDYASADDPVRAGLSSLDLHGDFDPGEMDRLLAEGEADIAKGDTRDGEEFFREMDEMSARKRRERGASL